MKGIRNPFTYTMPVIKLAIKELQSAKFYTIFLVLVMFVGIFSLAPVLSRFNVGSGRVVNISLHGSASEGWNFTIPGPTITVNQGDLVNLTLTSADGIAHNFFVDYNGDTNPSHNEPKSPDFTATTNYQFIAYKLGIFTYYCQYQKSTMYGIFRVAVIIRSTGRISTLVYARSGSAKDIQAAADQVATSSGGIGNVYIPSGTFNFVEVGEPWVTVEIPAGINVFGALTERDANGQVIEWKTVLVMPYESPDGSTFFKITGEQDSNNPVRFSDIKLVGYREFDPNSTTRYNGLVINDVIDFRVDHCYFRNVAGNGVSASVGAYGSYGRKEYGKTYTCGVIDHSKFTNTHGIVVGDIANCTVSYGVMLSRGSYSEEWEEDISKVLGHYTNYTVFIEDCYFEKWRHCVAANHGAHYVFRHNTIKYDFAYGSLDAHGWGFIQDSRVLVGTRAIEVYENELLDPVGAVGTTLDTIYIRGGGGVVFNNTVTGYTRFVYLSQEASDDVSKCQVNDVWVWNNSLPADCTEIFVYYGEKNPIEEGVHYHRHAPRTFSYTPYIYPHPLTLEKTP